MTPFILTLTLLIATLGVGEFMLWRMFRRRVDPVIFPVEQDASSVAFFRPGRMKLLALMHTLTLGAALVIPVLWLW
jgi:hypothetical protein